MTAKINKTNAARLLDKAKIAYELVPYEVDENNLAATHVAEQLGENIAQVFKTLVLRGDKNGLFVCVVPGDAEVDLKLAGKSFGQKKCGDDPYERTVTGNRVYPGRMLSGRNEKGFAHFYSYYLHGFRVYLHQCRDAGITDQDCAGRSGGIYPGRGYRSYSHLTRLP